MFVETQTSFLQKIAEAASWCDYLLKDRKLRNLRSPELNSTAIFQKIDSLAEQEHFARKIILTRRSLIQSASLKLLSPEIIAEKGRLLFCYPNHMQSDGIFNYGTGGFFDENDLPPFDSWICYGTVAEKIVLDHASWYNGLLISWVPAGNVKQVSRIIGLGPGKQVSWGGHFEWVDPEEGFLSAISCVK